MTLWCLSVAAADTSLLTAAQPSALLSVDQNRTTVIERIVTQWGAPLEQSGAGLSSAQLRTMLQGLRADHLLAASLAGSLPGLRDVLANSLARTVAATSTKVHIKAIGDVADDLVYTPVSPCRLFDTRPAQGGLGVMNPNVRRTYGAITPVANQGGPGGCNAPAEAAVALIQIGTLTPAGNGYLQGGPQGVATFPNALILYQPGDQYGTSVAMPLNVPNGQFDVQVQFAPTDLYGDLLGYFQRPGNYKGTHVIAGFAATDSGGFNSTVTGDYSTVGGGGYNTANGTFNTVAGGYGNIASSISSTVAGGEFNTASGTYSTVAGGTSNTATGNQGAVGGGGANHASGTFATVPGGFGNIASGTYSIVAGGWANNVSGNSSFAAGISAFADQNQCFVFANWSTFPVSPPNCLNATNVARFLLDHGWSVDYHAAQSNGGGDRWVYIGDLNSNQTITTWTGAYLSDAGVWVPGSSSKATKTDFAAVDPREVLQKVARLPITTWRYKEGEGAVRHLGPMAEDFDAAFGVGYGPHTISDLDARGVALAAIQGLNAKVDEQTATIREQQREIAELMQQVQGARHVIADVVALKGALAEFQRTQATVAIK